MLKHQAYYSYSKNKIEKQNDKKRFHSFEIFNTVLLNG